jgi:hypothetical protein
VKERAIGSTFTFTERRDIEKVRALQEELYGLRGTSEAWNDALVEWDKSDEFCKNDTDDPTFRSFRVVCAYDCFVDNVPITGVEDQRYVDRECGLQRLKFESRVIGVQTYFMGMTMQLVMEEGRMILSQTTHIETMAEKFQLQHDIYESVPIMPGAIFMEGHEIILL